MIHQLTIFETTYPSDLSGLHVAITGRLRIPRRVAINLLEGMGAQVDLRITRETDLLIVGDLTGKRTPEPGKSRKILMAERWGIRMVFHDHI